MEHGDVGEVGSRRFQHPVWRLARVDFRVAFVGEDEKAVPPRERRKPRQIGEIGDRALRVGRRGEIHRDRARAQRFVEAVEVGHERIGGGRREIDRLAVDRFRRRGVRHVERIGDQDRRLPGARADPALRRDGGEEQALARAAEHDDFVFRIERAFEAVAPAEPIDRRATKLLGAFAERVAAEPREMRRQHRPDKGRNRMLRLAHREVDGRLGRLEVAEQLGKAHERRARVGGPSGRRGSLAFGIRHGHGQDGRPPPHGKHLRSGKVKARLTIAGLPLPACGKRCKKREAPASRGLPYDRRGAGYPPRRIGSPDSRCVPDAAAGC